MNIVWNRTQIQRATLIMLIALLTFFLSFYNFAYDGYGNLYYSAAVKSMSMSWHNFFYLSFDPAGFLSVDKPPVALWIETAFVKIFGFHSFSLMLPEALAALGSVLILYHLVKRSFGFAAGCIAALLLAVTPVFIAAARSNNPDAMLVLILLLAAWAITIASKTGHIRHLVLAAVILGIGFNTKMLVAYLILPAFVLVYLWGSGIKWNRKVLHLAMAAIILVVVSFCWVMAVDLTPAANRPYVGSSSNNSEMNLVFGYNGLNRLKTSEHIMGNQQKPKQTMTSPKTQSNGSQSTQAMKVNHDTPGVLRMLEIYVGEQISWFLPLAAVGTIGAVIYIRGIEKGRRRQKIATLLLWGCWTIVMLVFFSFYRSLTHRYYLNVMAPGLAALGGIGFSCMVKLMMQEEKPWTKIFLPIGLCLSAAFHLIMIAHYPVWFIVLWPFDAVCIGLAVALLLFLGFHLHRKYNRVITWIAGMALGCLLVAPAAWSFTTVAARVNGSDAYAGPSLLGKSNFLIPSAVHLSNQLGGDVEDPTPSDYIKSLSVYLERHQNGAQYLVAMPSTALADKMIIFTGKPVMAIGGYNGANPILTLYDFQMLVKQGKVKYLLDTDAYPFSKAYEDSPNAQLLGWAIQNGRIIPPNEYLGMANNGADCPTLIDITHS